MALPHNKTLSRISIVALLLAGLSSGARAQQTQPPAPVIQAPPEPQPPPVASAPVSRLLTGKLIYVAPMPNNLDSWLQEDLRNWGRYRVTSNPEGVDLEISAVVPERQTRYKQRAGVPLPKNPPRKQPQETAINVVDWTSGAQLWSATLLDKNPKANSAPPAPAASIEIAARDMTPDQLALKITRELQRYVEQLDSTATH
jgi:hypothetical protein